MTETEKKALALVNEVAAYDARWTLDDVKGGVVFKALCRAIEQHEAFKLEVSDAVEKLIDRVSVNERQRVELALSRFIIAKPDPLVEVINDADDMVRKPDAPSYAEAIRAALAARGGRIVWEGE